MVTIVEQTSPYYIVASSTGGAGAATKIVDGYSVRVQVDELENAISGAWAAHLAANFPQGELLPVDSGIDGVYASQTLPFESQGTNWRVVTLSPIETESTDSIVYGGSDGLIAVVITPSLFGAIVCFVLFVIFFRRRHEREIVYCDWRFTGLFIIGCMLLNLACLSFIGPNTDELCLMRMWLLHLCFVIALAPLIVKTWRMRSLVGKPSLRRQTISHTKTAMLMVPFILVQVMILLIFTFVDPNKETQIIEQDGSSINYRVVCSHDTKAFLIVQLIYEGGILIIGCILAWMTRNMEGDFGESKQLIVAMYNIAVVASLVVIVANVSDVSGGTMRVLVTVAVCWSTIFSTGVFVLPRLLQLKNRRSMANLRQSSVNISGISLQALSGLSSRQISGLGSSRQFPSTSSGFYRTSSSAIDSSDPSSEREYSRRVTFASDGGDGNTNDVENETTKPSGNDGEAKSSSEDNKPDVSTNGIDAKENDITEEHNDGTSKSVEGNGETKSSGEDASIVYIDEIDGDPILATLERANTAKKSKTIEKPVAASGWLSGAFGSPNASKQSQTVSTNKDQEDH